MMPTDQIHLIAFLVSLSGIAALGVGAFVYIWRTTPKRKRLAVQESFDFEAPPKAVVTKAQTPPPMAHV